MLKNNAVFNISELKTIFGTSNLVHFENINKESNITGISTDTRTIENGNIFIALKGENFDGHNKIQDAFELGATVAIIDYKRNDLINKFYDKPFITVRDTLTALGMLATHHRRRFSLPVIAVAGSNGKTTTKDFITHLLSKKYKTLSTIENYNNQVGVPIMLLQLNDSYQVAVIEMGTNEPGEVAILSSILEPTHGIITNIGKEHLEKLIDLNGVEFEETFLFGYLFKHEGLAFINNDDPRLKKYSRILNNKITYGSSSDSDINISLTLDNDLYPIIKYENHDHLIRAKLQTIGMVSGLNAIAAVTVALTFNLSDEDIIYGLESFSRQSSHSYARMTLQKIKNLSIINDCYNANPDSMKAALFALNNYVTKSRKIAILGDMRELGDASFREHCDLLNEAVKIADIILITGSEMKKAYDFLNLNKIEYFDNKDLLCEFIIKLEKIDNSLTDTCLTDDCLLVKGSRGMQMEKIIDFLNNNL